MKKNKYFTLLFLIILISCNKNENIKPTLKNDKELNKVSNYLKLSKTAITTVEKESYLNKSFQLIKNDINNNPQSRDYLSKIVFEYYFMNDFNKLNKSSSLLLSMAKKANDTTNLGLALRSKAFYFKSTSNLDSSFYYYFKAEKLYINLNDRLNYANVLLNKGSVQYFGGDNLGAELSLTLAYNLFKDLNNSKKIFETLIFLGNVSEELKDFNKAIIYYSKALEISNNETQYSKAICYNNLGYVYLKINIYEKAIFNFENGLKYKNISKENPSLYANLIDNVAFSKLKLNKNEELLQMFLEALKIREELKLKPYIIISKIHLSQYYSYIGDFENSLKFAKNALELSKISKIPSDKLLSLQQLSEIDKNNASKYSKEYIRISDSLQVAERNSRDRFARIQLETDELRQENTVLTIKNKNILFYFYVFVILGSLLFFVRWLRMRSRELALKQAQQQANEEIYRLIISHQNKLDEGKDLEKKRISKELHDGILGRIFGLRLNLDGLNNYDDNNAKKSRLEYLNELKVIEQDLREISHELSRENLAVINNFLAIINNLLDQQSKVNKATIHTVISDKINWDEVSNIRKINIYRILQEALQNINKYANAKNININLDIDNNKSINFIIEDDGNGFDLNSKKNKGIGTKNMLQRTQQCNGTIKFKSEIKKGTKIIINLPPENTK